MCWDEMMRMTTPSDLCLWKYTKAFGNWLLYHAWTLPYMFCKCAISKVRFLTKTEYRVVFPYSKRYLLFYSTLLNLFHQGVPESNIWIVSAVNLQKSKLFIWKPNINILVTVFLINNLLSVTVMSSCVFDSLCVLSEVKSWNLTQKLEVCTVWVCVLKFGCDEKVS